MTSRWGWFRPTSRCKMRELKQIKISSISLVQKVRNRLPLFFHGQDQIEFKNLVINSRDGTLTILVFDPSASFLKDSLVKPGLFRDMAHEYMRSGAKLEKAHSGKAIGKQKAAVVESFFVQRGDPRFEGLVDYENKPVDATGAWAIVVKLIDPKVNMLYRGAAAWSGASIFGEAIFDKKKANVPELLPGKFAVLAS